MIEERKPSLILIEGLPGSGKSTMAHFLLRHLVTHDVPSIWWYEETKGHPLYLFDDAVSVQHILDDLAAGDYRNVIAAALDKWRQFAEAVQSSVRVVLLDSCLFGYLTWTLFPFNVPQPDILGYLADVERIIRAVNPRLIYLHQRDVPAALARICARRGGPTEERLIRNATESPYGKQHLLHGFAGMAALWTDYRVFTDEAFARIGFAKIAIENSAGDWAEDERQALRFLGLPDVQKLFLPTDHIERFTGTYWHQENGVEQSCAIFIQGGDLFLDGVSLVWPRSRLIVRADMLFDVESLPFVVTFVEGASGSIERMMLTGPELLSGPVNTIFEKRHSDF